MARNVKLKMSKLKEFPLEIYNKVWENILILKFNGKKLHEIDSDVIQKFDNSTISYSYTWNESKEGSDFWMKVYENDFTEFYERYPTYDVASIKDEEKDLFNWLKT